jgi:hypothetical protein
MAMQPARVKFRKMQRGNRAGLAYRGSRTLQRMETAQESTIGLVRPRHWAVSLPTAATQCVESAVIAHARKCVRLHHTSVSPCLIGKRCPRETRSRMSARDIVSICTTRQLSTWLDHIRQEGRGWAAKKVLVSSHALITYSTLMRFDRLWPAAWP